MTEIARMWATVGADTSSFKREMDDVGRRANGFKTTVGMMQTAVVGAFAAMATAAVGMGIGIAKTGFEFLAMKEQANIAFTTMLGSGQAAQGMLDELQAFAAKTPFEFPDLVRASQRLMAMGFKAQDVIPTLTAIGDAVAALGGTAETVDRVTTALGQMQAKGKASAEEMMQLTEAGIPAWQMLADKIGVSIPDAMKMVTKGAVSAETAIAAVTEGINTRFGGMMEKQATTWNGLLSNIKDSFAQLSAGVMKPFFDFAKAGLEKVVAILDKLNRSVEGGLNFWKILNAIVFEFLPKEMFDRFARFEQHIQDAIIAIQAIVQPILQAIGKFVTWKDVMAAVGILITGAVLSAIGALIAAMWPVISTIALVTAAVVAMRLAWQNDFMGIRTFTLNTLRQLTNWFYNESGIWKGTFEKTLEYLKWWASGGWKNYLFFPVRSRLIELRNEISMWATLTIRRFNDWIGDIKDWVRDALHQFSVWKEGVIHAFSNVKREVMHVVNTWLAAVKLDFEEWVAVNKSKLNVWYGWVKKYFNDAMTIIKDWFRDAFAWFKPTEWVDKGKAIVQGLYDGMVKVWNTLKSWWDGVWGKDLTKTVKVEMKTNSPSKVMEQLGKWTMQGFGVGAEKMLPYVEGVMGGISAASMGAGNYAYAGAGASGGSSQEAALLQENNSLLRILIAELRGKNMNVTVQGGGGGAGYSEAVAFRSGLR